MNTQMKKNQAVENAQKAGRSSYGQGATGSSPRTQTENVNSTAGASANAIGPVAPQAGSASNPDGLVPGAKVAISDVLASGQR